MQTNVDFQDVFFQHHNGVFRLLFRIVGSKQEAEDLVQEVFVRLHDHWDDVEPTKTKAWLYQVATRLGWNTVRNSNRRKRWHYESGQHKAMTGNDVSKKDLDTSIAVRAALAQLPERQAHLLMLYSSGLSHIELAEAMNVKKSSLSQMLFRSKKAFEKVYSPPIGIK